MHYHDSMSIHATLSNGCATLAFWMQSVPLFHAFFGSTSIHFKMERMWILQLLHAGINLDDDAKIYRSNKLMEFLLSFHASSMSDSQSSFLVLQVFFF